MDSEETGERQDRLRTELRHLAKRAAYGDKAAKKRLKRLRKAHGIKSDGVLVKGSNKNGKARAGATTLLAGDGTMTFTKRKVRANVAQHLRSQGHTVRMGVTHGKNGKTLFLLSAPVVANAKAKAAAQEKQEQEKKAQ